MLVAAALPGVRAPADARIDVRHPAHAAGGARLRRAPAGGRPGRGRAVEVLVDARRGGSVLDAAGRRPRSAGWSTRVEARSARSRRSSTRRRPAATSTRRGRYAQVIVAGAHEYGFPRRRIRPPAARRAHPGGGVPGRRRACSPAAARRRASTSSTARTAYFPSLVAAVLVLTYVLLVRAFRSLLLPLKAVLLNLLSVGAAYGMLVIVFRWGVGEDVARAVPVRPGRGLDPDLPVRDAVRPLDGLRGVPRLAHARGLGRGRRQRAPRSPTGSSGPAGSSRRRRSSCAPRSPGFVAGRIVGLQQFGVGLAVAIFIDATIVRALLVPS